MPAPFSGGSGATFWEEPLIDLYGMASPNALKIVLMLEELGLPHRLHYVDVWSGDQFTEDFRKLNPNAKVPVLVDPDGPGGQPLTVFESGAVLIYLAEKTGRLLPAAGASRYEAMQWLMIQLCGIGPVFGQHVHFQRFAPQEQAAYGRDRYRSEAVRLIELLDQRLAAHAFLGGADYSVADIATYPWVRVVERLGLPTRPNVTRWVADIAARPAAKAMEAVAAEWSARGQAALAKATPDDLDRMFGRGVHARSA